MHTHATSDADLSPLQDPKMFKVVQTVYFIIPVVGGMWIMNKVTCLSSCYTHMQIHTHARTQ